MIALHRTADRPTPLAILVQGDRTALFPWEDLLSLRELAARVPLEAADDEDWPRVAIPPWAVSGSTFGIALMREAEPGFHWFLEAEEWEELRALLYVGDELLSLAAVARSQGRKWQRVKEDVEMGRLFAFRVSGRKKRVWEIPEGAV